MLSKNTQLALAAFLVSLAADFNAGESAAAAPTEGAPTDPPKRRGRPPGGGAAAGDEGKTTTETGGMTLAQFREKHIEPRVKEGLGEEVKKVITKYSPTGAKDMKPEDYGPCGKDLDALAY